jgi:hypothetical protein
MAHFERMVAEMPKMASRLAKLKTHFTRGMKTLDRETQRGLRSKTMRNTGGVPDSLVMTPAVWAANKIKGKIPVQRSLWKNLHKPALNADIALGNVGHDITKHIPGLRSLFLQKEKIPVGMRRQKNWMGKAKGKGEKMFKEVERPSVTAPLSKATALATPFIVGSAAEKHLKKRKEKRDAKDSSQGVE